jgi:hypothetical protein
MFSYTGLTPSEVAVLRTQFHIYMLSSGRISVAGRKLTTPLTLLIFDQDLLLTPCFAQ